MKWIQIKSIALIILALLTVFANNVLAQKKTRDSIVYKIIYKDTVIYRYDTVHIKHYIHSDTIYSKAGLEPITPTEKKKGLINSAQWGIGPSIGAYYSPFNGFDMNIGFGIQYYFLAIPTIRNPHLGHRRKK